MKLESVNTHTPRPILSSRRISEAPIKKCLFVDSEIFVVDRVFLWTVNMCSEHISRAQMVERSLWMAGQSVAAGQRWLCSGMQQGHNTGSNVKPRSFVLLLTLCFVL